MNSNLISAMLVPIVLLEFTHLSQMHKILKRLKNVLLVLSVQKEVILLKVRESVKKDITAQLIPSR